MRKLVLVTSLAAVLAAPALANAQSACRRSDSGDRVAGTVIGGIAGAIVGSAVAGRKDSTTGALVGGAAGAVVGNQIAKRSGEPCPQGYYEVRDQGYDQRYAPPSPPPPPPPPPPPVAYRDRPAVYDYRYSAYDRRAFWAGAPQDFDQRIAFLEDRVARGRSEGSLSRREADQVRARLDDVRRDEYRMRRRGGRLDPRDYAYLDDQLDSISRQIRWERADDRYDRRR